MIVTNRVARHWCNWQKPLGLLFLWPICLLLMAGCGPPEQPTEPTVEQRIVAQKAKERRYDCYVKGDRPFKPLGKCLVWDLEHDGLHEANSLLGYHLEYHSGAGPITVFLVSRKASEYVGEYVAPGEVPGEERMLGVGAYLRRVQVCVVQFSGINDTGTALASHEVVSLQPPVTIENTGPLEVYGDIATPLAEWINDLASDY